MNRRYSLASLALAALGLLSACSKSDIYDGEYSKDGYYNESRVIYFPNSGADTIVVHLPCEPPREALLFAPEL